MLWDTGLTQKQILPAAKHAMQYLHQEQILGSTC
jgi:hypothetical protein